MLSGDYHSHPYSHENDEIKTELELERGHYYRFSDADFRSVKALQDDALDYRVGLVATVFERERKVKRTLKKLDGESCIRFQYLNMTIWLKAYVWTSDENMNYRRKADKMVRLVLSEFEFTGRMTAGLKFSLRINSASVNSTPVERDQTRWDASEPERVNRK